jgi:hypothetical protein
MGSTNVDESIEDFLARAALVDSSGIERALEIQAKSGGSIVKYWLTWACLSSYPKPRDFFQSISVASA